MTKETYRIRGMTDKEWAQLMQQYDKRIAEERKELGKRRELFKTENSVKEWNMC